jgi:hypothetical protein
VLNTFETFQEQTPIGCIIGRLPGESSRPDSRSAVESIDFEASVVSECGDTGCVGNGAGLEFGVALERRRVLHDIGNVKRSRLENDDAVEERGEFGDFPWIR